VWRDDATLIIGWDDCVTTVSIKTDPTTRSLRGEIQQLFPPPTKRPQLTPSFQMDSIIAGLLPFPPNLIVLSFTTEQPLSRPSSSDSDFHRRMARRPEIRVISPAQEELSSDALSLKDYARLRPGDYSVHWNERAKCVYIVSPGDIVVGRERTAADRVEWLLGRGRYKDALEVFEGGREGDTLGKWTRREIGVKFIEHLVDEGRWEEAAEQMPGIYGHDAKLWEKSIFQFAKKGHLKVITH
jgi:vacuolar protein sorting-associated protein 41